MEECEGITGSEENDSAGCRGSGPQYVQSELACPGHSPACA